MSAWSVSGERSLPDLLMSTFLVCTHMDFPQWRGGREKRVEEEESELSESLPLLIRPSILSDITLFNLNYLLKALSQNTVSLGS